MDEWRLGMDLRSHKKIAHPTLRLLCLAIPAMMRGGIRLTRHGSWQGTRQQAPSAACHVAAIPRRHA